MGGWAGEGGRGGEGWGVVRWGGGDSLSLCVVGGGYGGRWCAVAVGGGGGGGPPPLRGRHQSESAVRRLTATASQTPGRIQNSRSTLRFRNLLHRCNKSRIGGSTFWILPGVWVVELLRSCSAASAKAWTNKRASAGNRTTSSSAKRSGSSTTLRSFL